MPGPSLLAIQSDAPSVDFGDVWTGSNTPTISPAGPQTIPAGQSRRWLVTVRVDSSVNTGDTFDNTATIQVPLAVRDPDLANNSDTATLTAGDLLPTVDPRLQKGNVTAVAGGQDVSVALTVTNPADGSSTLAEGVTIVE